MDLYRLTDVCGWSSYEQPGVDPCWRRYEGSSGRIELPPIQSRNVVGQRAAASLRWDMLDGRRRDRRLTAFRTALDRHDPT